ncbi:MAG: hypothetical protein ACKODX_20965 [Gemmata sp.]
MERTRTGVASFGRAVNGWLKMIWRYNGIGGEDSFFVKTAYHVPGPPPGLAMR